MNNNSVEWIGIIVWESGDVMKNEIFLHSDAFEGYWIRDFGRSCAGTYDCYRLPVSDGYCFLLLEEGAWRDLGEKCPGRGPLEVNIGLILE
jgi:hypothetical protein